MAYRSWLVMGVALGLVGCGDDGASGGSGGGGNGQGGEAQGGEAQGGEAQGGEAQGGEAQGGEAQGGEGGGLAEGGAGQGGESGGELQGACEDTCANAAAIEAELGCAPDGACLNDCVNGNPAAPVCEPEYLAIVECAGTATANDCVCDAGDNEGINCDGICMTEVQAFVTCSNQ